MNGERTELPHQTRLRPRTRRTGHRTPEAPRLSRAKDTRTRSTHWQEDTVEREQHFLLFPACLLRAPMKPLLGTLLHVTIYTTGTFYALPFKPLFVLGTSAPYARAYAHFRRDHSDALNLAIHVGCLVAQLAGNFGLLALLDEICGFSQPFIAAGTALLWAATILVGAGRGMPLVVGGLTLACLAGGFAVRLQVLAHWRLLAFTHVLCEWPNAWYISRHLLRRPLSWAVCGGFASCRVGLFALCVRYEGVMSEHAITLQAGLLATCAATSLIKTHTNDPICEPLGLAMGWMVALLAGQPLVAFICTSYVAGYIQGVAHVLTNQEATMSQLTSVVDEIGHTTYFPALLLQSVHQSLTGKPHSAPHAHTTDNSKR